MPRFLDLFFGGLDARKGWIGAGFRRFGLGFSTSEMRLGGLTSVFWAENQQKKKATAKAKAISWSLPTIVPVLVCDVASGVANAASKSNADPNRALAVVIPVDLLLLESWCDRSVSNAIATPCFKPTIVVDESGSCE